MSFTEGEIVGGKVTSITKFGAFVALEDGKSGLVHISEIADSYVSDIRQFLTEGQAVSYTHLDVFKRQSETDAELRRCVYKKHFPKY